MNKIVKKERTAKVGRKRGSLIRKERLTEMSSHSVSITIREMRWFQRRKADADGRLVMRIRGLARRDEVNVVTT